MHFFESSADIHATPEAIWSILTDASKYPAWNPSVSAVDGTIAPGQTIKVQVKANPGRTFPVKVTEFQAPTRMTWSGGMPLGLFKGVRTYRLTPSGEGTTKFEMREEYTGLMLPVIWKSIPDLAPSFEQFAQGLKVEAEKGA